MGWKEEEDQVALKINKRTREEMMVDVDGVDEKMPRRRAGAGRTKGKEPVDARWIFCKLTGQNDRIRKEKSRDSANNPQR